MKGPNKRENTILLNICTERLEFLNPPSPNQIEWSAKRAGCWITLHMHDSHIFTCMYIIVSSEKITQFMGIFN